MKIVWLFLSFLFFVGCGGGSGSKNTEELSLNDLNKGGYILTANIYNISNGAHDINGIKANFCKNNNYKESYPNGLSIKGRYYADANKGAIALYFPTHTSVIYNGSSHIFVGNTYVVSSKNLRYNFIITRIEKSASVNCE